MGPLSDRGRGAAAGRPNLSPRHPAAVLLRLLKAQGTPMDQTVHRLAETFGIVNPSARQRTLPPPLRQLHQQILRHFAEHATAPEAARLREGAHQLDIELDEALAQLVSVDLVEADPATARLLGAYPFSAIRRGHKVQLADRPTVEASCAISA